jgi:hypothetical protein
MTARAEDRASTWEGPFIVTVAWDGSTLHATGVRRGGFDAARPPEATDDAARQAVAAAFRRCGASADRLICPSVDGAPERLRPSPSWSEDGRVSLDASTGVVHVRGRVTGTFQAGYDASEVVDGQGRMTCYAIAYST